MNRLKISLNVDDQYEETIITIQCKEIDDNIQSIIDFLKEKEAAFLIGTNGDMQHILKPDDIHYVHTENNAVVAVTGKESYVLKEKLYELETLLPTDKFIRISKSVIANLYELEKFEASFNGTLCVHFKSGAKEYVSRTYVQSIKHALKMNRRRVK